MRKRLFVAVPLVLLATVGLGHLWATQARVYLAPDDHTDFIWSTTEAGYTGASGAFVTMLDFYLAQADATAGQPSPYQSRFSTDGSHWLWVYERTPGKDFARLMRRVADGHLSVPLTPLACTYGGQATEGILRGMYYPGRLERRHGVRFTLAQAMENQTMPLGLAGLWAGSGARYAWQGVCGCDTQVPSLGAREAEIYRWVAPDGLNILMKWFSYSGSESIGGYAEARNPQAAVDYLSADAGFNSRYPFPLVKGAFGQGWDDVSTRNLNIQAAAIAKTDASRQVVVSNQEDYFRDFEATYGQSPSVKSLSVSYGNEWDTYVASLAEVSARVKRSAERLRTAEALQTLVTLQDAKWKRTPEDVAKRDLAFQDMGLYYEHDFLNGGPGASGTERIAWQRRLASEVEAWVNPLLQDSAKALGARIERAGSSPRFFAFNALSWTRSDVVDFPYAGAVPVHVVDVATGQQAPSQIVTLAGQTHLRVLATNVPSVGYKVFEVRAGLGQDFSAGAPTASAATGVMENAAYRVTVAPRGAITSLLDKSRAGREFAQSIGGRVLNDLGAGGGTLAVENAGPVSVTLVATSPSPLQHTTRVTLFRGLDRVDIRNEVMQNPGNTQWTWGFGFNLASHEVRHEELGAILRARKKSNGGDYATQNARYDWLSLNHFVDVTGAGPVGVTLSNADASFMRVGNSTVANLDEGTPQVAPLLSGLMTANGGIPNQGGDTYFLQRYALRTHGAFDAPSAMRFSLEHQNPLLADAVTGVGPYPGTSYSALSISNPSVLLWALKPAEEGIGEGVIARVWNLAGQASSFDLQFAGGLAGAQRTTHIETDVTRATVSAGVLTESAEALRIKTYRLLPARRPGLTRRVLRNRLRDATVLWRNEASGELFRWTLRGSRVLSGEPVASARGRAREAIGTADLDQDGTADVIWRRPATGAVWASPSGAPGTRRSLPSPGGPSWRLVSTADFDQDGRPDLLWRDGDTGETVAWLMGSRRVRETIAVPSSAGVPWEIVGSADFNGDGRPDLLWRNPESGQNHVSFLDGLSPIGQAALPAFPDTGFELAAVADLSSDGQPDLLWRNRSTGVNYLWVLSGVTLASGVFLPTVTERDWVVVGPR